ncbi:hypothetical protein BJ322DRAFT_1044848 [Thelephora terrestris]|uniref:Uncharacterized protein n=1 Tax=Thelephora terrestris TaxID=56493 RepID=A0A9P6LAL5_9AGAM|nr:hypothetical protein BJ322DRAFT_1044848 [Thelephora terrestris]
MDQSAPLTVAKGTTLTTLAGGFLWGIHGTVKGVPALGLYASSAALSSGIAGVTFFGIREYLISPLFVSTFNTNQHIRQRRARSSDANAPVEPLSPPTFGEMRFTRIPDTATSGAIAGALLSSWKFGYRRALPGAVTSALFCATLQLIGNELGVQRVKYISRRQTPNQTTPAAEGSPSESWTQLLFRSIGFQRVAQDEYLSRLKRERDAYLVRIAELEKRAEEEKRKES